MRFVTYYRVKVFGAGNGKFGLAGNCSGGFDLGRATGLNIPCSSNFFHFNPPGNKLTRSKPAIILVICDRGGKCHVC